MSSFHPYDYAAIGGAGCIPAVRLGIVWALDTECAIVGTVANSNVKYKPYDVTNNAVLISGKV